MKTEDMTVGDVLRAGAKKVRQGWCQGTSDDLRGNVCALGALYSSAATYADAVVVLCQALGIRGNVATWNDREGQTAENVALGLEFAADYWDAQQKRWLRAQQTPAIVWTMREDVPA